MRISRWRGVIVGAAVVSATVTAASIDPSPVIAAVPEARLLAAGTRLAVPLATSDGRYLVMGESDGSVVSVDVVTGAVTTMVRPGELNGSPVIAEGSTPRLVWGETNGTLMSRPLAGGPGVDLGVNRPVGVVSGLPIVSPDGRYVSWLSASLSNLATAAFWLAPVGGPAPTAPLTASTNFFAERLFTGDSSALVHFDNSNGPALRAAPVSGAPAITLAASATYGTAPSGHRVWYRTETGTPAKHDVWTVNADGTGASKIATAVDNARVSFSPDGATISVLPGVGGPATIGPATGGTRTTIGSEPVAFYSTQFTRDSARLVLRGFFPANLTTHTAFDSAGGSAVSLGGPGLALLPASADSSAALFTSAGSNATSIFRANLSTGTITTLATVPFPSVGGPSLDLSDDGRTIVARTAAPAPDTGDMFIEIDVVTGAQTVLASARANPVNAVVKLQGGRTVVADVLPCLSSPCTYDLYLTGPALPTPLPTPPTTPTTPVPPTTPTTPTTLAPSNTTPAPVFESVANPTRVLNTRDGTGTSITRLQPGQVLELQVSGRGGVPPTAGAAALNVTAVDPADAGYLTVWPCGTEMPTASNLNFGARQTVPNSVIAKLGATGTVCFAASADTGLIADLSGWYGAASSYRPLAPERVLETRRAAGQIGYSGDKPVAGQVIELQVTGVGNSNVPANADAAVLNITGVGATDDGYLTVWPCGSTQPGTSSLNLTRGATRANLVVARIGAGGKVCIFTDRGADVLADLAGYFPAASGLTTITPARLLDTRAEVLLGYSGPKPVAGQTVSVQVIGPGAAPSSAGSVVLNVTGVRATEAGFVTAWPCGEARPDASNLNLEPGVDAPNLVIARVGAGGQVCLFTERGTDLLVDLAGWI